MIRSMDELKTFRQWAIAGRSVRAGEHANYYLVSPDRSRGLPLFALEQTEPAQLLPDVGIEDWTEIIGADEWREIKNRPAQKRIRINDKNGFILVWAGANKEAVGWLRSKGYRFDMPTHRWAKMAENITAEQVAAAFESRGYNVIREWLEYDDAAVA